MIKPRIDSIPSELLARIIVFRAYSEHPFIPLLAQLSELTTSLRLVCSHWNHIVISTPSLWTSFIISFDCTGDTESSDPLDYLATGSDSESSSDARDPEDVQIPPSILTLWLQRSAKMPMTLEVFFPRTSRWTQVASERLAILWTSVDRWKYASLHLPFNAAGYLQLSSKLADAWLLESLNLHCNYLCRGGKENVMKQMVEAVAEAPNLQSLDFSDATFVDPQDSIAGCIKSWMPLIHLTRLVVESNVGAWGEVLALSLAYENLEWLSLRYLSRYSSSDPADPITFPLKLRNVCTLELHLIDDPSHSIRQTLVFDCPKLQILSLAACQDFALDLIFNITTYTASESLQVLRCRIPELIPISTLRNVADNAEISQIPIVEITFEAQGYPEVKCSKEELQCYQEFVKRYPRWRFATAGSRKWMVGRGSLRTASQMVKKYFRHPETRPLHSLLD